ncbi:MAG: phosphatase PAP2 family protein, partial [Bryobacteraceae bacterium]
MNPSALAAVSKVATREPVLRRSEWVLVLYFIYTAFLTILFSLSLAHRAVALAIPALLMAMAHADGLRPRFAVSVARDWLPAPLILVAYWQMDWFRGAPYLHNLERSWLALDRVILHQYKLQAIVESAGYLIPDLLEISYTLVYAIPPLSIAAIYLCHRRKQVDSFLFPFLLGILATYAFLPYFPSASPRLEFPGQDLPAFHGIFRRFNLWILDHGDIHTSVFPSGHVATAFAAAFAMKHALPGRKWLYRGLFIEAVLVTVATIYGRYHYLSDCVAAFALSGCAAGIVVLWERWPNWQPSRRQWRTAACVAAVLSLIPQTAEAGNTLPQLQETRINIRLETDISTYTSRVGDPVRAIVISPVKDGNRILMPRGSVLYGEVRNVTRIGRGFIHERASLKLEFNEWEHSGGIRQHHRRCFGDTTGRC